MPTLTIQTNPLTTSDVVVMGASIVSGGGQITITDQDGLEEAQQDSELVELATDDAFGPGSSTLIIGDGTSTIPQADVAAFLLTVQWPNTGPYGLVVRDSSGQAPTGMTESEHEALYTLAHDSVQDGYEEFAYTGPRVTNATLWTSQSKTTKIRETQLVYTGWRVTQMIEIQYDQVGVESYRLTTDITYSGNRIATATVTRTP